MKQIIPPKTRLDDRIYNPICASIDDNGYPPAPEDIANGFGMRLERVQRALARLCYKGWLYPGETTPIYSVDLPPAA